MSHELFFLLNINNYIFHCKIYILTSKLAATVFVLLSFSSQIYYLDKVSTEDNCCYPHKPPLQPQWSAKLCEIFHSTPDFQNTNRTCIAYLRFFCILYRALVVLESFLHSSSSSLHFHSDQENSIVRE